MKRFLTLTIFAALLASCSTAIFDIEEEGTTRMLSLRTVAEKGEITYPISIYAYSGDELAGELCVESSSDEITLNLPTGVYDVYAVSGSTDFSNGGYTTEPLMVGKSSVTLGKENAQSAITLKYAVARLNVALTDVPENITEVKVSVGALHNSINKKGEASGSTTVSLQCHKQDDTWLSDTVYVLPSVSDNVTLEISHGYSDNGQKTSFSYEYPSPIQAGYPYNFKGSYTSGITMAKLSLAVDMEGWGEDKDCSFVFGEGAGKDGKVTPSNASVFYVNKLPEACSVWNGHVVATIDEEGNALLFSLKEWTDVSSVDVLDDDIVNYTEGVVSGWSMPTEVQASGLIELCRNNYTKLNAAISEANGTNLQAKESRRYLCENLSKWYDLYNKTTGRSLQNTLYFLRLVKPVYFVVKQ